MNILEKIKQNTGKYIGNALILLSLIGFIFIYYPIIALYLFPQKTRAVEKNPSNYILEIPKIHAVAPIILNVDPWNPSEYKEALKKGVAQAKGTVLPGKIGLTYLFAHSSGLPWEMTRYNTIFYRLGELSKNDKIIIHHLDKTYQYIVVYKKEVWPSETQYLTNTSQKTLIVQTCVPIGTDLKRLLVFATLQMH